MALNRATPSSDTLTMVRVVVGLMLAAVGVGGFVAPQAEALSVEDERMEVALSVGVADSQAVVARVIDATVDDGEVRTIAMALRPDGRWGATVDLRRADMVVVFEDVTTGRQSSPSSLTELGVDSGVLLDPTLRAPDLVIDDDAASRLWLPVALILAFLAAVAVWVSMGMGEDDDPVTPDAAS